MTDPLSRVAVVLAVAWYLSHQAGRLDRLHHRVDAMRHALDENRRLRAESAAAIGSRVGGPLGDAVVHAAKDSLAVGSGAAIATIAASENALTHAMAALLRDEHARRAFDGLEAGPRVAHDMRRLSLSRRFHADAVQACLRIRRQRLVRWLHLAGRAPMPQTVDFADELPGA